MRRFAALVAELEQDPASAARTAALARYLARAAEPDRLWATALLTGRRPKRLMQSGLLRQWAAEAAGIPDWLFDDALAVSGDLAETIALLIPPPTAPAEIGLADQVDQIRAFATRNAADRRAAVLAALAAQGVAQRLVATRLMLGTFRLTLRPGEISRALAAVTGLDEADLALRLSSDWHPDRTGFAALARVNDPSARPYPFARHLALVGPVAGLGDPGQWRALWHWGGVRVQLLLRQDVCHLWSDSGEVVGGQFPELATALDFLPGGTVIDGELVAWQGDAPLPAARLHRRLRLKAPGRAARDAGPVILMAQDLLEWQGRDQRHMPVDARRAGLAQALSGLPAVVPLRLAAEACFADWPGFAAQRQDARRIGAAGLILLPCAGTGPGWLCASDPMTLTAVLLYVHGGALTCAVRDGADLVPLARVRTDLAAPDASALATWVRQNTVARFGPVRQVTPEQLFDLAFDAVDPGPGTRAGLALRGLRLLRWRRNGTPGEVQSLDALRALLRRDP